MPRSPQGPQKTHSRSYFLLTPLPSNITPLSDQQPKPFEFCKSIGVSLVTKSLFFSSMMSYIFLYYLFSYFPFSPFLPVGSRNENARVNRIRHFAFVGYCRFHWTHCLSTGPINRLFAEVVLNTGSSKESQHFIVCP